MGPDKPAMVDKKLSSRQGMYTQIMSDSATNTFNLCTTTHMVNESLDDLLNQHFLLCQHFDALNVSFDLAEIPVDQLSLSHSLIPCMSRDNTLGINHVIAELSHIIVM